MGRLYSLYLPWTYLGLLWQLDGFLLQVIWFDCYALEKVQCLMVSDCFCIQKWFNHETLLCLDVSDIFAI